MNTTEKIQNVWELIKNNEVQVFRIDDTQKGYYFNNKKTNKQRLKFLKIEDENFFVSWFGFVETDYTYYIAPLNYIPPIWATKIPNENIFNNKEKYESEDIYLQKQKQLGRIDDEYIQKVLAKRNSIDY